MQVQCLQIQGLDTTTQYVVGYAHGCAKVDPLDLNGEYDGHGWSHTRTAGRLIQVVSPKTLALLLIVDHWISRSNESNPEGY
jgi:hypothetical protein